MTAVSDAGPLIALAKLGASGLLHATFTEVSIPDKVFAEVVLAGDSLDLPDATDIRALVERGDISVVSLSEERLPDEIRRSQLGMGEKHAMALALRDKPDWLLIDDAEAREEALALGLPVKGTLGAIVLAVRASVLHVEDAIRLVRGIQESPTIWIDHRLCDTVVEDLRRGGG